MIFHKSEFDFRRQECTKIRSKIASKMAWLKFAANTLQDASKTLTRRPKKLSDPPPKTPPRRPKMAPRRPQDAPRRPQDDPKTPQDAPKMAPRRSQDALRTAQDAPRRPKPLQDPSKTLPSHPKPPPDHDFGMILGSLWKIFGRFFGRNCRPTCLLELTIQKSNYLKRNENFPKARRVEARPKRFGRD